jgi:biofilm PGA synthesis N-glycosyltransferase PgaC
MSTAPSSASAQALAAPTPRKLYLKVRTRFLLTLVVAASWAGLSLWLSFPWIYDLSELITTPAALLVVGGIAIVPGYLNAQLVTSLLVDRPPQLRDDIPFPPLSLVIAAHNEARTIGETLAYAQRQDYGGRLDIVVVDDGSTDGTADVVRTFAAHDDRIRLVEREHAGKGRALNAVLPTIDAPLVATIDADTLLMPDALRRAVARLLVSPPDTVAVAGTILARNSRANALARIQAWDYFLGIASVKRQQALLQGTLVAQGAFSVYNTRSLRDAGGWPDRIGEDIVLTWAMIRNGGRTTFEPTAIGFTEVPTTFRRFARQRQRWARGMIEGLRDHGFGLLRQRRMHVHSIAMNFLFPYLDGVYTCAFLPGVALAAFGSFVLVGPVTAAVLPLSFAVAGVMFVRQRRAFREVGLSVRRNRVGFLGYLLVYQLLLAPISFFGYLKELAGAERVW